MLHWLLAFACSDGWRRSVVGWSCHSWPVSHFTFSSYKMAAAYYQYTLSKSCQSSQWGINLNTIKHWFRNADMKHDHSCRKHSQQVQVRISHKHRTRHRMRSRHHGHHASIAFNIVLQLYDIALRCCYAGKKYVCFIASKPVILYKKIFVIACDVASWPY